MIVMVGQLMCAVVDEIAPRTTAQFCGTFARSALIRPIFRVKEGSAGNLMPSDHAVDTGVTLSALVQPIQDRKPRHS